MDVNEALALLADESQRLDAVVADLPAEQWKLPTPATGWTIADQIAHLHWTDLVSVQTVRGDPAFAALVADMRADPRPALVDEEARRLAGQAPAELLAQWRAGREALAQALAAADPAAKIAWFGPPMRPLTMATARVMETWAHSLDVCDALGLDKPATDALAAVARIGCRTRGFAFASRGLEVPTAEVRVELALPHGSFAEGPADAPERIMGDAWGFAAVVTQRRSPADVDLAIVGEGARHWMEIAQAFAGAPTQGPAPGERGPARTTGAGRASGASATGDPLVRTPAIGAPAVGSANA
ncbi:TIGR03084 family metal-binding protein [Brevibacterium sp. BRM-1]|uniref:TIGR03084 family metal-binding protein n=1 Tax=Brevibacterium sp. BRM-1 TaxID=2999062 RepID=UPI0022827A1A|nr:TIGR03084 family metal-binding protein [Brevibacterium sp. BRM-1]WAL40638.1 TIGR03084 family metal-binding protein [Brevibacterium sp. BRM-1]